MVYGASLATRAACSIVTHWIGTDTDTESAARQFCLDRNCDQLYSSYNKLV